MLIRVVVTNQGLSPSVSIVLMNANVFLLISGVFWSSADFIATFVCCDRVKQLNGFLSSHDDLNSLYTSSPIVILCIRFSISSESINSPVIKFMTLSLEKPKGLLLSLKYSKKVSKAILSALFADEENSWCRLYSSSTMRFQRISRFDV